MSKTIELSLPVSARLTRNWSGRIHSVTFELVNTNEELTLLEFEPNNKLGSSIEGLIDRTKTQSKSKTKGLSYGATLSGPVDAFSLSVGPSIDWQSTTSENESDRYKIRPEQFPEVTSGTAGLGHGAWFRFHATPQTTVEGGHLVRLRFQAPPDWRAGWLEVSASALGEKEWWFIDQDMKFGPKHYYVGIHLAGDQQARHAAAQAVGLQLEALTAHQALKPTSKSLENHADCQLECCVKNKPSLSDTGKRGIDVER